MTFTRKGTLDIVRTLRINQEIASRVFDCTNARMASLPGCRCNTTSDGRYCCGTREALKVIKGGQRNSRSSQRAAAWRTFRWFEKTDCGPVSPGHQLSHQRRRSVQSSVFHTHVPNTSDMSHNVLLMPSLPYHTYSYVNYHVNSSTMRRR